MEIDIFTFSGFIPATWTAWVESEEKSRDAFTLITKSGDVDQGALGLVTVVFEPQSGGYATENLHFKLAHNDDEFILPLEGHGLPPVLKITETNITFQPTLPYVHNCFKSFTIENPCSFPIEYFFSDFDE